MSSHVLTQWEPENTQFWAAQGKNIARQNLWISIPALLLAFSVWMVWSVVVVNLPNVGFTYSTNQLFWLTALPALSGATLRIFYSFLVPMVGGRRFTAISTASLLIPAVGIGMAVQDPTTSYPTMLVLALLCGLGGGNFSSSMANISFFYPKAQKGTALGLNAGLGNLGVSVVQFVVPLVITMSLFGDWGGASQTWVKAGATKAMWLQNAGYVWVPFIVVATLAAWFGMHDIASAKSSFSEQAVIFRRSHNWRMCWLYLGTFGSFIGFSAAFPMLMKSQFPTMNPTQYAFLGPLVGALARPLGGWLSDKIGGAKVSLWVFAGMAVAVAGLIYMLSAGAPLQFAPFFALFMALFICSGVGNASTFRMIPVIFSTLHQRETPHLSETQRLQNAARESAAVIGFAGAIGAYGGFFIPKSFGTSIAMTGSVSGALACFVLFYSSCIVLTWWCYARSRADMPC